MFDINGLTQEEFEKLPLVIKGESKEVRYIGKGMVVIKFLPTVYSFTENRCDVVPGSSEARLSASKIFTEVLAKAGINHAYRQVTKDFVLAKLVVPHAVEYEKYGLPAFIPNDLSTAEFEKLPKAPPIEIIAKRYLTGTTKHSFIGLAGQSVRKSHGFYAGMKIEGDGALPEIMIRFDWRNPLNQVGRGKKLVKQMIGDDINNPIYSDIVEKIATFSDRVADQALTPQLADYFIDVKKAQKTAFMVAQTLEDFLASKDIVFCDLCMFIDESGELVYGEISPDCGRYRHLDHGSLDKDEWRTGGSSTQVIKKWEMLTSLISQ